MEVSEASALLDIVKSTEPAYTWFSASGTGKIDWDGQRLSAKLDVRIRRQECDEEIGEQVGIEQPGFLLPIRQINFFLDAGPVKRPVGKAVDRENVQVLRREKILQLANVSGIP